ncbi:S41 family peptidase [Empedobacter falsenii]
MFRIKYLLILLFSNISFAQSIDDSFSQKDMLKDLEVFKNIRIKANSGLYKYRSKEQIDSIYSWAENQIIKSTSYRDFHTILSTLTDYEGSLHNDTSFSEKFIKSLSEEKYGYFPFPLKNIENRWIINIENDLIPLGSEIIAINDEKIGKIEQNLSKYYTTDGFNQTGKKIGLQTHFSKYYRFDYGQKNNFIIEYKLPNSNEMLIKMVGSIGFSDYYKKFRTRYSKPFDKLYYSNLKEDEKYHFKIINASTAILTINSFTMGNEKSPEHKDYKTFLNNTFKEIKNSNINNLIIDVRLNGGGSDPNDILTYSYLTNRDFQENKEAWISFHKIPYTKYYNSKIPKFIRPLFIGKYNRELQAIFQEKRNNYFYQNSKSNDHKIWKPNPLTFHGKIYLLISPAVASAGSLFSAMVAGNDNSVVIGEETMGGYYGHNGHTSFEYKLPKSKIITTFSIVNLKQDVPQKSNQLNGRGIIPDYKVSQTFEDFIKQEDTQLNFVIDLIQKQVF